MTSEEPEVMEVDKEAPSEGKAATTQKAQKVTSHELPWYAGKVVF